MKIQLKRSNQLQDYGDGNEAKRPTAAQMEFGELAVNYNSADPAIFMEDSDGNIIRIAGNNAIGGDQDLGYTPNGDLAGTVTITDGTDAIIPIATDTVAGLFTGAEKQKLDGIETGATNQDLGYVANGDNDGTVTITSGSNATIPVATNAVAGLFTGAEKQQLANLVAEGATNQDLGYTPNGDNAGTVTITDGTDAIIPIATDTVAGLFTGAEKQALAGLDGAEANVAPLIVQETAPAARFTNDLWWANSDEDDGGGRLYAWTGSEWVDTSIPGGALTQTDGDTRYLSAINNDTAAGAITFEGLTTHEAGVSVTGGSAAGVVDGFYGESNQVFVATNGVKYGNFGTPSLNNRVVQFGEDVQLATSGVNSLYNLHSILSSTGHGAQNIYNVQSTVTADTGTTAGVFLFDAKAAAQTGANVTLYGFHTDIVRARTPNGNTYSIYCRGDAPAYFDGDVTVGGRLRVFTSDANVADSFSIVATEGSSPNGGLTLTLNGASSSKRWLQQLLIYGSEAQISSKGFEFRAGASAPGTERGSIQFNSSGGVNFNETSDYRTKSNVQPLSSAVDIIKALNPISYSRGLSDNVPGFLAHELQEVFPVAVTGAKDATEAIGTLTDWDGTELDTEVTEPSAEELTYTEEVETNGVATMVTRTRSWSATGSRDALQQADQTKLIPLLTKALQEAFERIEALEGA